MVVVEPTVPAIANTNCNQKEKKRKKKHQPNEKCVEKIDSFYEWKKKRQKLWRRKQHMHEH